MNVSGKLEANVPSKPMGGDEEYTFSPDGKLLVFSARIAGREEAWSTNFDLYEAAADGTTAPKNLTADNPAWDTQPVFLRNGDLAWLAMKRPGFEADRFAIKLRHDGAVRDVVAIRAMGFPVFTGALSPADTQYRGMMTAKDTTIRIGGTDISPGDIVVGDVDGIVVVPRAHALAPIRAGDFRAEAAFLCLEQPLGGRSSATVFFLADLGRVLGALGDRGYRAANLEAGILGGRLYLAAYAQRFGATGLTFYDTAVAEFFAPHARGKDALFVTALGRSVPRPAPDA